VVPPELDELLALELPPVEPPDVQPPELLELEDELEELDELDEPPVTWVSQTPPTQARPEMHTVPPQQSSPASPHVAAVEPVVVPAPVAAPVLPPELVSPELALPADPLPAEPLPPPVTTSVGGASTTAWHSCVVRSQLSPPLQPTSVQSGTHWPAGQKSPAGQSTELRQLTK
jgi:hypothetical protein